MNDQALIARVLLDNDQHAFASLVRKYQHPIRHFLRRLTSGDHSLADDLAQEVFLAAYTKIQNFRAESSFGTWLHSIAYRVFLNDRRKAHYAREVSSELVISEPSTTHNTEQDILVERLMSHLSVGERTCVTLAYSAGMSHQEIVEITGMPLGTVKSHINRGKQKLVELVNSNQPQKRSSL